MGQASSVMERAATLESTPAIAAALDRGAVTAGHVDAITRAGKTLDPAQREELLDRVDALVDVAEHASQAEFARRVRDEARRLQAADGMDTLERQRRATSLRTWVDVEGMWNLKARFDPLTGVRLDARLRESLEALFATSTPDTCPTDPGAKQDHLRALALADLILTGGTASKPGRPEYVVVIDADDSADRPVRARSSRSPSRSRGGSSPNSPVTPTSTPSWSATGSCCTPPAT